MGTCQDCYIKDLKTVDEWAALNSYNILDYDGFSDVEDLKTTKINQCQFNNGIVTCTVEYNPN